MAQTAIYNFQKPSGDKNVDEEFYQLQETLDLLDSILAALQTAVDAKSAVGHTHAIADVLDLAAQLAAKMPASTTFALDDLTDVSGAAGAPDNYVLVKSALGWIPSSALAALGAHGHLISEITGLVAALAGKADAAATTSALAGKADATATATALAGKADASRVKAPTRTVVSGGSSVVSGTYTRPAGCTKIKVELQAAGGGGGYGRSTSGNSAVGGGGGGGQWGEIIIDNPAASYPYSLGENGKGGIGSSSTGATGAAASTFGSPAILTCAGGAGGGSSAPATITGGSVSGGDGGTGTTGGTRSVPGARGGYGVVFSGTICFAGDGGASFLGVGNHGASGSTGPLSGICGSGGTGGARSGGAISDGGEGGFAILIIQEYYD
jgi:hypothetical protein